MQPERRPTVTIAHRAGNSLPLLQRAVAAGVDFVEADIRWDQGPVVRHARRLPFLPVYWDRWYIRWDARRPLTLALLVDLLRDGPTRLYLDIKAQDPRAPRAVLESLLRHGVLGGVEISSQYWPALEALRRDAPGVRLFRSVGHEPQLRALLPLLERDPLRPTGVAIDRKLLTPALAAGLRQRDLEVYAWGVEESGEARRLTEWGATGIIADDLDLLRSLTEG